VIEPPVIEANIFIGGVAYSGRGSTAADEGGG
jgi:hypothetical protein